jgi:hypothetical protein
MAICHQWSWRGFEVNTKDNAENGVLVTGLEWRRTIRELRRVGVDTCDTCRIGGSGG